MNKGGYFSFHGGFLHNLVIFIAWYKLINSGWKVTIQDMSFKSLRKAPSVPDILAKKVDPKITNYIIEIETKMTSTTARKKWKNYIEDVYGYDLLILNCDDIKKPDSLKSIGKYVEGMLP